MNVCNITPSTDALRSSDHSSIPCEWDLETLLGDALLVIPDISDTPIEKTTLQLEDSPSVLESLLRDPNDPELVTFFGSQRQGQALGPPSGYSVRSRRDTKADVAPRKTRISPDEKKRRNRECMRRLRHRRVAMIAEMREQVAALNQELRHCLSQRGMAMAPRRTVSSSSPYRNDMALKITLQQLREENYWLQQQVHRHETTMKGFRDVVRDNEELFTRSQSMEDMLKG
ncbi:hypothetical protein ATCC90586_003984 [Pythium insidiosum]|nr:hypothetical protein ATCC90586_003984 [Pythium insidiosum]